MAKKAKNEIMMLETPEPIFAGAGNVFSTTVQNMFSQAGVNATGNVIRVSDIEGSVTLVDGRSYLVKRNDKEIRIYQTAEASATPGTPGATIEEKKPRRSGKSILRTANAREQEYLDEVVGKLENKKLTRQEMSKAKKQALGVLRDVQDNLLEGAVLSAISSTLPRHFFRNFKIEEGVIEAEFQVNAPRLIECKTVKGKSK